MRRLGRIGGNHLRLPFLITGAALISMGIFALIPLLLRQTSYQSHLPGASYALLIPVKPAPAPDPMQPEHDPEPPPEEPEPPEPEIEAETPDVPEIEPPELEPLEMEPPEVAREPLDTTPLEPLNLEPPVPEPPQVRTPALHVISLSALPTHSSPMNLKVDLRVGKAPVPKAVTRPAVLQKPVHTKARFGMDEVDQKPVGIGVLKPHYPFSARRKGIEGYVTVRFLVDRMGKAREITILDAKPPGIFDRAVQKTVPRWRFKPGKKAGQPVDIWVKMTIRFALGDDA